MQSIRRQISIPAEQDTLLKQRAKELGVAEADLIRLGIERATEPLAKRDSRAWARELKFIRQRAKLPSAGAGRIWTREDLYADRLRRRSS
jgi:hypothetical protein